MEEKKTYYKEDLIEGAIEDLQDRIKWIKENEEEDHYEKIEDCIHEIADSNIPIYTYDLLQYASNNFDLIQAEGDTTGYLNSREALTNE